MASNGKTVVEIRGLILPSALFLMAGTASIFMRISTGEWLPILSHSLGPVMSGLLTVGVLVFGFTGVWLGVRLRIGQTRGLGIFGVVAALAGALSLVNAIMNGSGWFEAILCAFLVIEIVYIKLA